MKNMNIQTKILFNIQLMINFMLFSGIMFNSNYPFWGHFCAFFAGLSLIPLIMYGITWFFFDRHDD